MQSYVKLKRVVEGLCFILDGLDEYRPKSMSNTFIFELIKRLRLPNAVVIIASRPAASARFRRIAHKKIEVIGFLKPQVYRYVEEYPFSERDKRKDLHRYLERHRNVHHMCYLPIHAAMVCYLFDIMGGTLPRTENEVSDFFRDVHCGKESMGLITVDCMARKCGFENLYTFHHLTFQEYLAAYHIYMLNEAEQLQLLKKHGKKRYMQMVWKFYCGLTRFKEKDIRFLEIMKSAGKNDLFGIQCAFVSQQSTTCDYVVQSCESGALSFQGHFLTPPDLAAIGYVLKNATCPVEKLVLNRCIV